MYRHDANRTGQYIRKGIVSVNEPISGLPKDYSLYQNFPNPFNPSTKIRFDIPAGETGSARLVRIVIIDALGREVKTLVNEELRPGSYEADFDAAGITSGVYFYSLRSGDYFTVKKMVLLK